MIKIINDLFKRFITGLSGDIVDTSDEKTPLIMTDKYRKRSTGGLEPKFLFEHLSDIKRKFIL